MKKDLPKIFLDSGAYSAYTKGITINIDEYISFIKKNKKYIEHYAVLDAIYNPKQTMKNQQYMEKAGLRPIPCYHYGEDEKYLRYYIDKKYKYIALGGMVPIGSGDLRIWLDRIFSKFICNKKGYPKFKTHGFGMTSFDLMIRYPWYSVDSTSWIASSRFGGIYVPKFKNGKYKYSEAPWGVLVSSRISGKHQLGMHINNFTDMDYYKIIEYIELKGFKLGESKFKGEEEIIIVEGLCNNYKMRDEFNIAFFMEFERNLPKYPWCFELKRAKGFF